MASNISVTLVIDNKQYIASLNQAQKATTQFAETTAATARTATTQFGNLTGAGANLHMSLSRLAGVATGAAFLGLARSSIQLADSIKDLSDATGIGVSTIVNLQSAVKGFGISMEGTNKSLGYFFTKINDAQQGGAQAQATFSQLGVNLTDLRNLTEQGLFNKVIEQLAQMPQGAEKTALQGELLGKAFRNVVIDEAFLETLRSGQGEAANLTLQIERAAKLNDQFEQSWFRLKLAFLEAFGPLIDGLSRIAATLAEFPNLITAVSIALLAIPGVAVGRAIVGGLSFAVKGFQALTGSAAAAAAAVAKVGGKGAQKAAAAAAEVAAKGRLGVHANTAAGQQVRNVGSLLGAAGAVAGGVGAVAVGKFANQGEAEADAKKRSDAAAAAAQREGNAQNKVVDALAQKRAALAAQYSEYLKGNQAQLDSLNLDSRLIGTSKEFADAERARAEVLKRSQDEIDKLTSAKAQMSETDKQLGLGAVYDKQIRQIQSVVSAEQVRAAKATENNNRLLTLEKQRQFGISQEVSLNQQLAKLQDDIATQMLPEMEKRYYAVSAAARAAAASEIAAEEARLGRKLNTDEVAKYYEIANRGAEQLKQKQLELLDAESRRNLAQFAIKARIDDENSLLKIQDEMAKMTLPAIEQKYYDISAAARDSAKAAIEAEEARLGRRLNTDEAKKYYEIATKGNERLAKQTQSLYEKSRLFSTGWQKAFNDYKDAATNSAAAATRIFEKFTSGIENALVDFIKTGKFEWENFVADMAEELLRSQIKRTIAGLGSALGLDSLFGGGGAGDAPGASPNNPTYSYIVNGSDVGGVGGGMGGGGGIIGAAGRVMGGGSSGGGGGILGTIGNVIGGVKNAVGGVFGGIGDAIGGVVNGIGSIFGGGGGGGGGGGFVDSFASGVEDLFSGFFANGGNIPAGRFGVAGELGPELVGGPSSITPMVGANVTYNINAVDAASFKAMIAADPSFLFAVTEQGRGKLAQGRR